MGTARCGRGACVCSDMLEGRTWAREHALHVSGGAAAEQPARHPLWSLGASARLRFVREGTRAQRRKWT